MILYTLTHSFPMHPFSTPWKHQKTLRFSDVFRGQRKGALGTNGLRCTARQGWPIGHKYNLSQFLHWCSSDFFKIVKYWGKWYAFAIFSQHLSPKSWGYGHWTVYFDDASKNQIYISHNIQGSFYEKRPSIIMNFQLIPALFGTEKSVSSR